MSATILEAVPVESIEQRVADAQPVDWRRAGRALLLALPLLLGFLVGRVRLAVRYMVAAFVEGMDRGMSPADRPAPPRTTQ